LNQVSLAQRETFRRHLGVPPVGTNANPSLHARCARQKPGCRGRLIRSAVLKKNRIF
jgi:hypothetical protein